MFIVVIEDRHTDVEVHLFNDMSEAVKFAYQQATESARGDDDVEINDYPGWVFHCTYSLEGDCAWVVERNPEDMEGCEHDYPDEWNYTYSPAGSKTCRKCGEKIYD